MKQTKSSSCGGRGASHTWAWGPRRRRCWLVTAAAPANCLNCSCLVRRWHGAPVAYRLSSKRAGNGAEEWAPRRCHVARRRRLPLPVTAPSMPPAPPHTPRPARPGSHGEQPGRMAPAGARVPAHPPGERGGAAALRAGRAAAAKATRCASSCCGQLTPCPKRTLSHPRPSNTSTGPARTPLLNTSTNAPPPPQVLTILLVIPLPRNIRKGILMFTHKTLTFTVGEARRLVGARAGGAAGRAAL